MIVLSKAFGEIELTELVKKENELGRFVVPVYKPLYVDMEDLYDGILAYVESDATKDMLAKNRFCCEVFWSSADCKRMFEHCTLHRFTTISLNDTVIHTSIRDVAIDKDNYCIWVTIDKPLCSGNPFVLKGRFVPRILTSKKDPVSDYNLRQCKIVALDYVLEHDSRNLKVIDDQWMIAPMQNKRYKKTCAQTAEKV